MIKGLKIRLPEELLKDLRKEAAFHTTKTGHAYSMNQLIVDVLTKAVARRKQARKVKAGKEGGD
jgi:hypothetical protein